MSADNSKTKSGGKMIARQKARYDSRRTSKAPAPLLPLIEVHHEPVSLRRRRLPKRIRGQTRQANGNELHRTKGKNTSFPHLDQLLKVNGGINEMLAIKMTLERSDRRHKRVLYASLARTYHLAKVFQHHNESWTEFCHQDFWEDRRIKPKFDEPEDGLRFLIHQIVAGDEPAADRRKVYNYLSALNELNAKGVKADDVASELAKKRGLKGLSEAWAERRRGAISTKGDTDTKAGDAEDGDGDERKGRRFAKVEGKNATPTEKSPKPCIHLHSNDFLETLHAYQKGDMLQVSVKIVRKSKESATIELSPAS